MGSLAEELIAQLECEIVFTIPIWGGIGIAESVVVTWIIMGLVVVTSMYLTYDLKVHNVSRKQLVVETLVVKLSSFIEELVGKEGKAFVPYLFSIFLYLCISNLIGIIGFKPPTKDLNVTAALAIMSILLIEGAGIYKRGIKGWLKAFVKPSPVAVLNNVLDIFIRPLALCMRLFGNVLGAFVIMELIKIITPFVIPVPFSFYFDVFDGLIQAYVFVFLTSLFIKEAID